MRRLVALVILLIHINTSMFIPVMDEVDIYDVHGNQVNDINTVVDYVDQVIMKHKPKPHPDSDDDQAHFFNIIKAQQFIINPFIIIHRRPEFIAESKPGYTGFREKNFSSITYDVTAPPPKA
ncbi:MAG: hypothetical protein JSS82_04365 [Bacteroidetes bacterium]|nr:hypothetical protein [Bacteroidota bacterium]